MSTGAHSMVSERHEWPLWQTVAAYAVVIAVFVGLIWAVVIALLGGLFPAIRAARLPVATALRAG